MFQALINDFQKLNLSPKVDELSIFEICGYPHYENVISNVLAFFLDSTRDHGLSDLFIQSLLEAAKINTSEMDLQYCVERERSTQNGGYIDLLLSNESSCVIIENKIFAPLYNNLEEYFSFGQTMSNRVIGVVLSLYPVETKNDHFVCVTYSQFFEKMRQRFGEYLHNQKLNYLSMMFDLIKSIERLMSGENSMKTEFVDFVRKNLNAVEDFGAELKAFNDGLRRIVNEVNSHVTDSAKDSGLKQWPCRELPELYDIAVSDFTITSDVSIAIDSVIRALGWEFQVFFRKPPSTPIRIGDLCNSKRLVGKVNNDNRFVLDEKMSFESKPFEVAQKILEIIKKLKA